MPNWIPVLIVLLTHGASGSIANVLPHDMVRMIQAVALREENGGEVTTCPGPVGSPQAAGRLNTEGKAHSPADIVVLGSLTRSSEFARDGPPAILI